MPIDRGQPSRRYTVKRFDNSNSNRDKVTIITDDTQKPYTDETGEPIKRKSKLTTPRPKNTRPIIRSMMAADYYGNDQVKIDHRPQPRGTLARMQEKGFKILSYSETDDANRPIIRRREEDDYYY